MSTIPCFSARDFRLSQKFSLLRIRANPRRGFALFSALNGLRIHPLLRFLKAKGDFAVCGRRQGLLALDLGRFFCKKSSAKKLQKGFATSSNPVLFSTGFLIYNSTLLSCIRSSPSLYRWLISEKHLQVGAVTPFSLFLKSMMVTPVCVY